MPTENKKLSAEEIKAMALIFTNVINVHEEPYSDECVNVECTSFEIYLAMKAYAAQQAATLEAEVKRLIDLNFKQDDVIGLKERESVRYMNLWLQEQKEHEALKQKADRLYEAAKGLRDYFTFMVKDPKFNEYVNAQQAITNYEKKE